jgi:hypothetical protein
MRFWLFWSGKAEMAAWKKEKREPFGSAQGRQAPALQNALIYRSKCIKNYGNVKGNFRV